MSPAAGRQCLERLARGSIVVLGAGIEATEPAVEDIECLQTPDRTVQEPLPTGQFDVKPLQNLRHDLVLQIETVLEDPVVALGPHDLPRDYVGQLRGDPKAPPASTNGALKDVADAHLASGLLGWDGLQPRRYVHPVAEDIGTIGDHLVEIDADAELDALVGRYTAIAVRKADLNRRGALDRRHNARELHQHAITVSLMMRPPRLAISRSISSWRWALSAAKVPASFSPIRRL